MKKKLSNVYIPELVLLHHITRSHWFKIKWNQLMFTLYSYIFMNSYLCIECYALHLHHDSITPLVHVQSISYTGGILMIYDRDNGVSLLPVFPTTDSLMNEHEWQLTWYLALVRIFRTVNTKTSSFFDPVDAAVSVQWSTTKIVWWCGIHRPRVRCTITYYVLCLS